MSKSYLLQLTARGVIPQAKDRSGKTIAGRWEIFVALRAYLKFLEQQAEKSGGNEWRLERTALMPTQARKVELETRRFQSTLIPVEDAIELTNLMWRNIRTISLATVEPLSAKLVDHSTMIEVMDILNGSVRELLCTLRELRAMDFVRVEKPSSGNGESVTKDEEIAN